MGDQKEGTGASRGTMQAIRISQIMCGELSCQLIISVEQIGSRTDIREVQRPRRFTAIVALEDDAQRPTIASMDGYVLGSRAICVQGQIDEKAYYRTAAVLNAEYDEVCGCAWECLSQYCVDISSGPVVCISDLCVIPAYRLRGLASRLLAEVRQAFRPCMYAAIAEPVNERADAPMSRYDIGRAFGFTWQRRPEKLIFRTFCGTDHEDMWEQVRNSPFYSEAEASRAEYDIQMEYEAYIKRQNLISAREELVLRSDQARAFASVGDTVVKRLAQSMLWPGLVNPAFASAVLYKDRDQAARIWLSERVFADLTFVETWFSDLDYATTVVTVGVLSVSDAPCAGILAYSNARTPLPHPIPFSVCNDTLALRRAQFNLEMTGDDLIRIILDGLKRQRWLIYAADNTPVLGISVL